MAGVDQADLLEQGLVNGPWLDSFQSTRVRQLFNFHILERAKTLNVLQNLK